MTTSEHDAAGRPARITRKHLDTGAHLYTGEVAYDEFNNLKTFKEQVGSDRAAYTTTFTHDNENRPTLLNFGGTRQVAYVYDGLGRISRRTVNAGSTGVATTYGYLAGGHGTNSTTPLVQTITQSGTTLTYAYDDAGNITSVSDGSKTISYEYDLLGQLTRVNDPYDTTAGSTGTTWKYAYDQGGNIQSKTAYAFTTGTVGSAVKTDSFTYGDANWKDKLTAFNGQTITYDAIGNPTNDGTWNYTWIGGRQMRAMYKGSFGEQGYDEITFEYNENGLRTKKTRMYYDDATGDIGYKATNYTLHGKNIVHLSDGSNNLHFFYDAQNKPAVVIFNGTAYAYLYNLQGDVIGLVDSNGTKMVSYTYDDWGKPISMTGTLASTLGTLQPFRYRGYVYDEECGTYYLKDRYYSSAISRFLNADVILLNYTGYAHNMFVYANCNPCTYFDPNGTMAVSLLQSACWIYGNNMAGAGEISTWALIANGGNVYTAFHEIAQLNVAKQLYARGYIPTLELRIEGVGEADIAAAGMLWEVKPLGTPGAKQLSKYTSASGMLTGEPIVPISDIPIVGNIRMGIMSNPSEPGVINYYFYRRNRQNQEERVKSSEVAQQVKSSLVLASATVALIMGVSLVENLAPVVGGVANDIASFVAALTIGSKCFGY